MRVVVDREVCESQGVCEALVPEVFHIGEDDRLRIREGEVPAALEGKVKQAILRCPKQALSLVDGKAGRP